MAADPIWTPTPVVDSAQHKGLPLDEALSSCLMKKGGKNHLHRSVAPAQSCKAAPREMKSHHNPFPAAERAPDISSVTQHLHKHNPCILCALAKRQQK